jgi:hypothetical protein
MTQPPIACALELTRMRDRVELIAELEADALIDQHPIPGGLRSRFRPASGVEERVRDLVEHESECCPFLHFEVTRDAALVLDITGPPDAQPLIRQFFATGQP